MEVTWKSHDHCSIVMRTMDLKKSQIAPPVDFDEYLFHDTVGPSDQCLIITMFQLSIESSSVRWSSTLGSIYGVQSTVTFVVSVSEQFKISVINTEQSSHLFIRLQMTKL